MLDPRKGCWTPETENGHQKCYQTPEKIINPRIRF
jgi:hypothetical protein